jgi:glycosyltransferase involved in cell wall biosynthesis
VAGDAALLVDPLDQNALGAALYQLTTDSELRTELVTRGMRQIQRFSWQRCALATLNVLEQVGHGLD